MAYAPPSTGGAQRSRHAVDRDHVALYLASDPDLIPDELRVHRGGHDHLQLDVPRRRVEAVHLAARPQRGPQAVIGEQEERIVRRDRRIQILGLVRRAVDAQELSIAHTPDGFTVSRQAGTSALAFGRSKTAVGSSERHGGVTVTDGDGSAAATTEALVIRASDLAARTETGPTCGMPPLGLALGWP